MFPIYLWIMHSCSDQMKIIKSKERSLLGCYHLFHSCFQNIPFYNHSGNFQQDPHMCPHSDKDQVSTRWYLESGSNGQKTLATKHKHFKPLRDEDPFSFVHGLPIVEIVWRPWRFLYLYKQSIHAQVKMTTFERNNLKEQLSFYEIVIIWPLRNILLFKAVLYFCLILYFCSLNEFYVT